MLTGILDSAFRVCLALFLIGGLVIVLVQGAGLLVGTSDVIENVVEWVGVPTFVLASVAGLLGFVLAYLKGWETAD